jgi:hypothetical protein
VFQLIGIINRINFDNFNNLTVSTFQTLLHFIYGAGIPYVVNIRFIEEEEVKTHLFNIYQQSNMISTLRR